jgi:hypothetical protein
MIFVHKKSTRGVFPGTFDRFFNGLAWEGILDLIENIADINAKRGQCQGHDHCDQQDQESILHQSLSAFTFQ